MNDLKYFEEVMQSVMRLKIGEKKSLVQYRHNNPDNYKRFVENVKMIIDCEYDILNGFELTFSDDYSILMKDEHPRESKQFKDAYK